MANHMRGVAAVPLETRIGDRAHSIALAESMMNDVIDGGAEIKALPG